ncbi:MAG: hypothetical protein E7576_11905 [Ruminococcaceae bacterium]|nr:hypothetical protein [Oscillospiraceae bacterium]
MSVLKKSVSCLLVLIMVVHLLPVSVLADGAARGKQAQEKTVSRPIPEVPAEPVEEQRIVLGSWDLDFVEETEDTGTTESRELTWTPRLAAPVPTVGQILEAEDGEEEPEEFEFVIEEDGTATLTAYNGSGPNVEIPSEYDVYPVKAIDGGVFNGHEEIETVVLPDMLSYIGDRAFWGCRNLKNVEFPSTLEYIGFGAFYDSGLEKVRLVSDFNCSFGGSVFEACTNLKEAEIGGSITSICGSMFKGDRNLERVDLNDGLLEIGGEAFRETGLTYIDLPDSVTTIESAAFYGCSALKGFHWPKDWAESGGRIFAGSGIVRYDIPDGVESIPYGAFEGAEKLVSVTIPDSVIAIGARAFEGCKNLETFNYPVALEEAGAYMIRGCESLKTIEIPEGVETIPESTFSGADCLREVAFPSTLKSIGNDAFTDCTSLQYVWTTGNLESIGKGAFSGCGSLESIDLSGTITEIPDNAFIGCSSLIYVKLPENLVTIGQNSFSGCASLGEIEIPASVATIVAPYEWYGGSFASCENLVFRCNVKSYAAKFALMADIPLICYNDNEELSENDVRRNSSYEITGTGLNASGNLPMMLKYDISAVENFQSIKIVVPLTAEVTSGKFYINGETIVYAKNETHYGSRYGYHTYEGCLYTFEKADLMGAEIGTISFEITPIESNGVQTLAFIETRENGKNKENSIGVISEFIPMLSLFAAEAADEEGTEVSGVSMPDTEVTLKVNGVVQKKVKTNRVGYYSAILHIDTSSEGVYSYVTAHAVDRDGTEYEASANIRFMKSVLKVTSFIMAEKEFQTAYALTGGWYGGRSAGTTVFVPRPMKVQVKLNYPEDVEKVYIVSHTTKEEKFLVGTWDEEKEAFVAEGYFDPKNPSYVPQNITVECVLKQNPRSFFDKVSIPYEEIYNELTDDWRDAEVTINEVSETHLDAILDIPNKQYPLHIIIDERYLEKGEDDGVVSFEDKTVFLTDFTTVYDSYFHKKEEYFAVFDNGYQHIAKIHDGDKVFRVSALVMIDAEEVIFPLDIPSLLNTNTTLSLNDKLYPSDNIHAGGTSESEAVILVALTIGGIVSSWASWYDARRDRREMEERYHYMLHTMLDSDLPMSEKIRLTHEMEAYRDRYLNRQFWREMIGVIGMVGSFIPTGQGQLADSVSEGLLSCDAIIAGFGSDQILSRDAERFKNLSDIIPIVKPIEQQPYHIKWKIDPSGYVYDLDTDERIPNAKATIYWIPVENEYGPDEEYWNNKPGEDEFGEVWDGTEYLEINPTYTNSLGQYAWDVPEGWWRVKVEAEDYDTAWSDWMPVPPEQTDVNIGLKYNKNVLLGDVNDDGTVDARDRRLLARILDGQVTDESEYFFRAADIDKDRELTLIDLTILARTLAGWADYAGKWGVVLEN